MVVGRLQCMQQLTYAEMVTYVVLTAQRSRRYVISRCVCMYNTIEMPRSISHKKPSCSGGYGTITSDYVNRCVLNRKNEPKVDRRMDISNEPCLIFSCDRQPEVHIFDLELNTIRVTLYLT